MLYIQVSVKLRYAIKSTAFNFICMWNKYVTMHSQSKCLLYISRCNFPLTQNLNYFIQKI